MSNQIYSGHQRPQFENSTDLTKCYMEIGRIQ